MRTVSSSGSKFSSVALILILLFVSMFAVSVAAEEEEEDIMWHEFTGPEANGSAVGNDQGGAILDKESQCVYNGSPVDEGSRIDIGKDYPLWENGSHSSDEEICVYRGGINDGVGGEWFDLDSFYALNYIENNASQEGGEETHCYSGQWGGTPLDCEDRGSDVGSVSPFWAPFTEGEHDDDYDPDGSAEISLPGVHNKIDVNTGNLQIDSFDSEWALTPNLDYSVAEDGQAYPPGNCYPKGDSRLRTSSSDPSIGKDERAMNNSYASSNGVWKDPDNVSDLSFGCDLTGPDLGIGLDSGTSDDSGNEIKGDIEFDDLGRSNVDMEPPVCGDDEDEYLVDGNRQSGSADYYCLPKTADNQCIDASGGSVNLVDLGTVRQINEIGENYGRLKNDKEVCAKPGSSGSAIWTDQDYAKEVSGVDVCRENNLYGQDGVEWVPATEVGSHPGAFVGGIDDSGDVVIENVISDKFDSLQGNIGGGVSSDETPVPTGKNVNSGPSDLVTDWTASKGFCIGDDEGERLVTQECKTEFCETDRDVVGSATVSGSCVFDHDQSSYPVKGGGTGRELYSPGENITLDLNPPRDIACFNGKWYEDWPIAFNQKKVSVPLGESVRVSFQVINVKKGERDFEVELKDLSVQGSSAYQFTSFVGKSGKSFTATVPPESSKTFQVEVVGGSTDLDGELDDKQDEVLLGAREVGSSVSGEDSMYVNVVKNETGSSRTTREVPGIGFIHMAAIMLMATLAYSIYS